MHAQSKVAIRPCHPKRYFGSAFLCPISTIYNSAQALARANCFYLYQLWPGYGMMHAHSAYALHIFI